MVKSKTVALCFDENGSCSFYAEIKHLDSNTLNKLKNEYESKKQSELDYLKSLEERIGELEKENKSLEHEIKVLKGEE